MRIAEKWCNDGQHYVPVAKVRDVDHKRAYVNLACGHSTEIYLGRNYKGSIPLVEVCHECLDDCRNCDEDFPVEDAYAEIYIDLGGG